MLAELREDDSAAVYSFTGMLTIPKLMTPFQIDLAIS
jgi:hypothetical protein